MTRHSTRDPVTGRFVSRRREGSPVPTVPGRDDAAVQRRIEVVRRKYEGGPFAVRIARDGTVRDASVRKSPLGSPAQQMLESVRREIGPY